jgi:type IV pilus assembly protein PilA
VVEFHTRTGRFPNSSCLSSNASVGLAAPESIAGSYVSQVVVSGEGCPAPLGAGSIVTEFSSTAPFKANSAIDTASLIFSPVTHSGSISWRCKRFLFGGSVVLLDKWLPSSCRN